MSSDSITKAKNFNATSVTYKEAVVNKRGGKSVQCQLNGAPIVLQFPLMLTWGINERVDEQSGRVSYDMALQFEPDKSSSIRKFLTNLENFQNKVLDDAVSKSKEWFGKSKLSREVAEAMMYPILKYPRKKDGSGDPDNERNPTLKLKVPYWDGTYSIELYDLTGEPVFLPEATSKRMGLEVPPQGTRGPVDVVPKASHVKGLLACTGVWMAGGRFGVTWKLVQACVRPPVRLVGSGKCHIADDSDDEEMEDSIKKYDAKEESVKEKTGPTFDDTDEGEEDVSEEAEEDAVEEVEEETPPEPKKIKKKVVRRKKVVKKSA
jgi:hypothetical protein|tara:strand:+ start:1251 stop:2210 length:960 start_codon:yes stop_codon:yes gene_type:complete